MEVSVLTPFRRIRRIEQFRLGVHGAYLKLGGQSGLLLPQVALNHAWTSESFWQALARKSMLGPRAWRDPKAACRCSRRRYSADQVFPANLETIQVAQHREGDLSGVEERPRDLPDLAGAHRFDALHQFVQAEDRPKYISWRARFDMRLPVDSRPAPASLSDGPWPGAALPRLQALFEQAKLARHRVHHLEGRFNRRSAYTDRQPVSRYGLNSEKTA